MQYDPKKLEQKWQAWWDEHKTFATPTDRSKPKYYVLDMFPYPSGDGLHVGHPKGYTATDVVARAKRMMGFNVLRVMGWDSFGLPAERRAERDGIHPSVITRRNIAVFKDQLKRLGLSYDWAHELATSEPDYYKWTQWIFKQMFERGLAYRAEVPVNFCPALGTVLANEEVHDGKYIETGDPVERRMMKQWMLRITQYADRLIDDLEGLDWPVGTLEMQRNWIGRSVGANVCFALEGRSERIEVFTTRPDTLFGGTYVVLAPEHALVDSLTTPDQRPAVQAYRAQVLNRSDRDRTSDAADAPKTGVFTGAYALNPVNGARIPVWIADYVLASYGTGAVFACPAHDERDWAFARTFKLPVIEVVEGGDVTREAYSGDGVHVNSGFLDGLNVADAKEKVIEYLEGRQQGSRSIRYRLRDWLFSRQRYWGEPFPTIELADGTVKVLPDSALPVVLPELDAYKATADGQPPLARAPQWVNTTDPDTGAAAIRDTNTMPQWAGSCWYYLRFMAPWLSDRAWSVEDERYWMPVDLYVGGSEHATLHLLYARFWHKVLYDAGLVSTTEPFKRLFHQGMIHAQSYRDERGKYHYADEVEQRPVDGVPQWFVKGTELKVEAKIEKMSKSRFNVVNPNDMCDQYGADAMRLYELFMGPLEEGTEWEMGGVAGTRRFLDRIWRLVVDESSGKLNAKLSDQAGTDNRDLERALHAAIKKVTESVDNLKFNTAISEMMVFVNEATRAPALPRAWIESFVTLVAPFAPHMAEELWQMLGHGQSITYAPWPAYDEARLARDTIAVAVQVLGKTRGTVDVPAAATQAEIVAAVHADAALAKHLQGKTVVKEIYVPGRLVNFVVR